jgi:hypothetical protein
MGGRAGMAVFISGILSLFLEDVFLESALVLYAFSIYFFYFKVSGKKLLLGCHALGLNVTSAPFY